MTRKFKLMLILFILFGMGVIGWYGWFYFSKSTCEAKGGFWLKAGMSPPWELFDWYCALPTSDGGKECTDWEECEGHCIAENLDSLIGHCQEHNIIFGCHIVMRNGEAGMLCVD